MNKKLSRSNFCLLIVRTLSSIGCWKGKSFLVNLQFYLWKSQALKPVCLNNN